ncbi:hypothetical protein PGT21_014641 [Puccinia graminis f. sp. tritici]|uniref:Uncharacterized protein n=1 Tax=Puccinia graminis f. sp. tritici TaxID=56615 RepID=A0A5B0QIG2_PUCGR|nr:hypothetical protein PGT21_014641 [Puccinia graminis f. sp. tritici]
MPLSTPLFSPISSPPCPSAYPLISSTISPTIHLGNGILKSTMPLRARRAAIYITGPSLLNRPVLFDDLLSFAPSRPGSVQSKKARWPASGSSLSSSVRYPQGGQWGSPGNSRLRRNFLPFQPPVYKGRLASSSSTSSPALYSSATSIPSNSEFNSRNSLLPIFSNTMVTTRSSKARAVSETPALPSPVTHGAPVARSFPPLNFANTFMISGLARPFTPVNSPETKVPVPVHPSTAAPESSRVDQHVDPNLVQEDEWESESESESSSSALISSKSLPLE